MRLRDRWRRFKTREPGPFYSYVWWETLLGFYFTIGMFVCFVLSGLFAGMWWLLWLLGFVHIWLDWWWTGREIDGRQKYRRQET